MPVKEMIHQEDDEMDKSKISRRQFLKTTAYVAPAILTLKAMPALAQPGSNGNDQPIELEYETRSEYQNLMSDMH